MSSTWCFNDYHLSDTIWYDMRLLQRKLQKNILWKHEWENVYTPGKPETSIFSFAQVADKSPKQLAETIGL